MLYAELDDLEVIATASAPRDGLPLCAVVRNEMYFLPAFLAHYRGLGVGHFLMLDDRSDDGTRAFLASQPDVTLIGSGRRYGDRVVPAAGPLAGTEVQHELRLIVPQRFFTQGQPARGDRHVYASRSRFIPPALLGLFERITWPAAQAGTHAAAGQGVRVDIAARMREMWR